MRNLINYIAKSPRPPTANNKSLDDAIRRERLFGLATSRTGGDSFRPFRGSYLLVEETSGQNQPIYAKEYKPDTRLPKIHTRGHTPFVLMSDTEELSDEVGLILSFTTADQEAY